jgi:hypothetical protein
MTRAVPSQVAYWVLDRAPLLAGLGILAFAGGRPAWAAAGWIALGLGFLQWLIEWSGYSMPRPGRTRVVAYGCWEQPMAFAVPGRWRTLLFYRVFGEAGRERDEYEVFALPPMDELDIRNSFSQQPLPEGHLLGRVPTAELRFQHRGGCHVRTSEVRRIEARLRA